MTDREILDILQHKVVACSGREQENQSKELHIHRLVVNIIRTEFIIASGSLFYIIFQKRMDF